MAPRLPSAALALLYGSVLLVSAAPADSSTEPPASTAAPPGDQTPTVSSAELSRRFLSEEEQQLLSSPDFGRRLPATPAGQSVTPPAPRRDWTPIWPDGSASGPVTSRPVTVAAPRPDRPTSRPTTALPSRQPVTEYYFASSKPPPPSTVSAFPSAALPTAFIAPSQQRPEPSATPRLPFRTPRPPPQQRPTEPSVPESSAVFSPTRQRPEPSATPRLPFRTPRPPPQQPPTEPSEPDASVVFSPTRERPEPSATPRLPFRTSRPPSRQPPTDPESSTLSSTGELPEPATSPQLPSSRSRLNPPVTPSFQRPVITSHSGVTRLADRLSALVSASRATQSPAVSATETSAAAPATSALVGPQDPAPSPPADLDSVFSELEGSGEVPDLQPSTDLLDTPQVTEPTFPGPAPAPAPSDQQVAPSPASGPCVVTPQGAGGYCRNGDTLTVLTRDPTGQWEEFRTVRLPASTVAALDAEEMGLESATTSRPEDISTGQTSSQLASDTIQTPGGPDSGSTEHTTGNPPGWEVTTIGTPAGQDTEPEPNTDGSVATATPRSFADGTEPPPSLLPSVVEGQKLESVPTAASGAETTLVAAVGEGPDLALPTAVTAEELPTSSESPASSVSPETSSAAAVKEDTPATTVPTPEDFQSPTAPQTTPAEPETSPVPAGTETPAVKADTEPAPASRGEQVKASPTQQIAPPTQPVVPETTATQPQTTEQTTATEPQTTVTQPQTTTTTEATEKTTQPITTETPPTEGTTSSSSSSTVTTTDSTSSSTPATTTPVAPPSSTSRRPGIEHSSVVPPVEVYVQFLLAASWPQFCKLEHIFRAEVAQLINKETQGNLTADNAVLFNIPLCGGAGPLDEQPPEARRRRGSAAILVFLYVTAAPTGRYDQQLTELVEPLWEAQMTSTETPPSSVAPLVREVDTVRPSHTQLVSEVERPGQAGVIAAITVGCVAVASLVLLAVLLIIVRHRRKAAQNAQRCNPVSMEEYGVESVFSSMRRKNKLRRSVRSYLNHAFDDHDAPSNPVNFAGLANLSGDLAALKEEFDSIPTGLMPTADDMPPGTEDRNRYANVLPVPETRVVLEQKSTVPSSDYINANYVRGPKEEAQFYIATQGPLESTVDDFWRMTWETQSKVIICLTDIVERGVRRCAEYLPPSEALDRHRLYGDYQVTLMSKVKKDKYVVSIVQLKNMDTNLFREVTHLWYSGWPEKGVPSDLDSLLQFLLEARKAMKSNIGPTVVHCSPGTGRTGVVLACDICIRQFETSRSADIMRTVFRLRQDRAGAVQTREQYALIYKVLNHYAASVTSGNLPTLD